MGCVFFLRHPVYSNFKVLYTGAELNTPYHEYERKKYLDKINFAESLRYTNNLAISL